MYSWVLDPQYAWDLNGGGHADHIYISSADQYIINDYKLLYSEKKFLFVPFLY